MRTQSDALIFSRLTSTHPTDIVAISRPSLFGALNYLDYLYSLKKYCVLSTTWGLPASKAPRSHGAYIKYSLVNNPCGLPASKPTCSQGHYHTHFFNTSWGLLQFKTPFSYEMLLPQHSITCKQRFSFPWVVRNIPSSTFPGAYLYARPSGL